ncbi:hypothetical protein HDU97_002703 [Phlyctochytrium planicorne]|nr:hypothetical protein HDU97_002703 [Phlyctochytrium planicorne]
MSSAMKKALVVLLGAASATIPFVNAQDFAASFFTMDIFQANTSDVCIRTLLSSSIFMGAYQSCGGLGLMAFPSIPYQVILETNVLPAFCSSNCTERLQSLRGLAEGDNGCSTANAPLGVFNLPESEEAPKGKMFDILRLFGGITLTNGLDMIDSLQQSACIRIDASLTKDPATLTKEDYCLFEGFTKAKPKLEKAAYNVTLKDVFSDKDLVCTSCFVKQRLAFKGKLPTVTTPLYTAISNAVDALASTQETSCKAIQPK